MCCKAEHGQMQAAIKYERLIIILKKQKALGVEKKASHAYLRKEQLSSLVFDRFINIYTPYANYNA